MEGKSKLKLVLLLSLGFVFITSLSALASSHYGKNFFSNFGRASIATLHDISDTENLHLAAEVDLEELSGSAPRDSRGVAPLKQTVSKAQDKISDITSSIVAAVASSPIVKEIQKLPEILKTTTTTPPPVEKNQEPTSTQPQQESLKSIVIYVVQINGPTGITTEDFISLFNPNDKEINISGWKLRKKTQKQTDYTSIKVFSDNSIIPAYGKFVWASYKDPNFYLTVDAAVTSTQTIAANNSIALLDKDNNVIDEVAWGDDLSAPYMEGNPAPNPKISLARRLGPDSMPVDTDNNLSDFEVK